MSYSNVNEISCFKDAANFITKKLLLNCSLKMALSRNRNMSLICISFNYIPYNKVVLDCTLVYSLVIIANTTRCLTYKRTNLSFREQG